MLRSIDEMTGYEISAADGSIGKASDFLFDDRFWLIRYLVADTGKWLPGRQVLLSPASVLVADWAEQDLKLSLTKSQIENSPPLMEDQPVHRQMEEKIAQHFHWPIYWNPDFPSEPVVGSRVPEGPEGHRPTGLATKRAGDPHLRSTKEVRGYHIEATDGEIGHVHDFIVDDQGWTIRYLVVDTRNFLPGRKVILSPLWIAETNWEKRKVRVDLTRERIKSSPEFDPADPVNREYEARLYDYYGRPKYWS